jgi:hypothetical protein
LATLAKFIVNILEVFELVIGKIRFGEPILAKHASREIIKAMGVSENASSGDNPYSDDLKWCKVESISRVEQVGLIKVRISSMQQQKNWIVKADDIML